MDKLRKQRHQLKELFRQNMLNILGLRYLSNVRSDRWCKYFDHFPHMSLQGMLYKFLFLLFRRHRVCKRRILQLILSLLGKKYK